MVDNIEERTNLDVTAGIKGSPDGDEIRFDERAGISQNSPSNVENPVNTSPETEIAEQVNEIEIKRKGRMTLYIRRFFRRPSAVFGLVLFLILLFFAFFGTYFTNWNYTDLDFDALSAPPSAIHWFGTTPGGSDVYAMVMRGLGRSMSIGIISSVLITIIAAVIGTTIAYFEGWFEKVGMWILDTLLVIPSFLLIAITTTSATGAASWIWLIIGLTIFGWIGYARVIRTVSLSLRELDYVKAAKFMGVHPFRIIVRHLIPNLGSILIISTVLGVVGTINAETSLSYLGLGIKPPDTSLGNLLSEGQSVITTAPWVLIFPALLLIILTFSLQLIGDGLRDAIDPNSTASGKGTV